jgi:flagellar protein FlaI
MTIKERRLMGNHPNAVREENPSIFREVYPIHEPYIYAAIIKDPKTRRIRYEVVEPTLLEDEKAKLKEIKKLLTEEFDVNLKEIDTREKAEEYLKNKVREIIEDYRLKVEKEAIDKFIYYIIRDFLGYGRIDALMKDQFIEDISADGVNLPIYVWHREHESLPTNIIIKDENELDSFIVRLAYLAGKSISIATPLLDASLPDGSRIQLTYGSEVTRRGSTFTIRRFRVDPLTISDLIAFNTMSTDMAAYFWYAIENRASFLVAGGVAAGKTTVLNCLSMFIRPTLKIVSVEDTPELNLPHENWIPSVVRTGFGHNSNTAGAITLYDLLKAAVRQRPDYIIVGEVRGKEVYTLFQAMATGHLGLSTIHGESVNSVLQRLESEPMNIPKSLLSMIDAITIQLRTEIGGKPARRTVAITEITDYDSKKNELSTNEVYRWEPKGDTFHLVGNSQILDKCKESKGLNEEAIPKELHRRKTVLEWIVQNKIRKHTDVTAIIREYYADPARMYRKARMGIR